MESLSCFRMRKSKRAGMECLTGAQGETVLDELFILCVDGSLADFAAAISFVIEKGMADGCHVHPYLMGAVSRRHSTTVTKP